ncbi:hypothetical protein THAOC_10535, partial [Thalassiosira oceanica]
APSTSTFAIITFASMYERVSSTYVQPISTELQTADILTKCLPQNLFVRHRKAMCGR